LTWDDPAFDLEMAPTAVGPFTTVPAAVSPYTLGPEAAAGFFRLKLRR